MIEANKNGTLKEAFGTGTAAVITPIGELASTDWKITLTTTGQKGPLAQKIYDELVGVQYGQRPDKLNWLEILDI